MQQTPTGPRNWEEIVKNSQGTTFFLPESLIEAAKKWSADRTAFFKQANELAKAENLLGMQFQKIIMGIREEFDKRGAVEAVWTQDIGFNMEALKEGKYIISFTPNKGM